MKQKNLPGAAIAVLSASLMPALPAHGASPADHDERLVAVGVLAHDRGPFSDHNENGVDLNVEVQFAPLGLLGTARPHLGATVNFDGETSAAYGGLSFRLLHSSKWHADGFLGVAVHNGPLHKDPVRCDLYSDCGYGTRFLPRFGGEIGYQIGSHSTVSLLYDHMSHKWIIGGENEGLDHIGLRYTWPF